MADKCHISNCSNTSYDNCDACGKPTCRQHGRKVVTAMCAGSVPTGLSARWARLLASFCEPAPGLADAALRRPALPSCPPMSIGL